MKFEKILNIIFFVIVGFLSLCGFIAIRNNYPILSYLLAVLAILGLFNFIGTIIYERKKS